MGTALHQLSGIQTKPACPKDPKSTPSNHPSQPAIRVLVMEVESTTSGSFLVFGVTVPFDPLEEA